MMMMMIWNEMNATTNWSELCRCCKWKMCVFNRVIRLVLLCRVICVGVDIFKQLTRFLSPISMVLFRCVKISVLLLNIENVRGIYPLASVSRQVLRPIQPPVQWVPESFPEGKARLGRILITHIHQVQRSRMSRSLHSLPLSVCMAVAETFTSLS
jgi:hypothetical protein